MTDDEITAESVNTRDVSASADGLNLLCGMDIDCEEFRVFAGDCVLLITADDNHVCIRSEPVGDSE